jgi:hypothetical protein
MPCPERLCLKLAQELLFVLLRVGENEFYTPVNPFPSGARPSMSGSYKHVAYVFVYHYLEIP